MKKYLLMAFIHFVMFTNAQSVQSVNSGSLITSTSSVSIGEIVVNPVNQNQSSSGIIGILYQINQSTLEVPQFELTENIVVYPNPTESSLLFKSKESLDNQKVVVYNINGQLITEKTIQNDNSVDLSNLSSGIYVIVLSAEPKKSFKIIKH